MKKTITKLLALALAVLMTLSLAACGKKDSGAADDKVELPVADGAVIGQGATAITVQITGADGKTVTFTVNTDEETVGAALAALNIVAGEDSQYGLMVSTIDGYTADFNVDGTYWAFYINDEYAMTGVDSTPIEDDTVYTFKVDGAEVEEGATISLVDGKHYGIGDTAFTLEVVDGEGNTTTVTVHTNEETLGAALAALNIVYGEDSDFGLYIKAVNNITADFNVDGKYWAVYIDGEYAMTGVDSTPVEEGTTYSLKVEG